VECSDVAAHAANVIVAPVSLRETKPLRVDLPREPRAAAMARAMLVPIEAVTDPRLSVLVTELVTNAVRHGGGMVGLTVVPEPRVVRVEVRDGGTGFDLRAQLAVEGTADGGFGLKIVEHMADRWGTEPGVVWFELDFE
jgi:signal transduction histidine kinase